MALHATKVAKVKPVFVTDVTAMLAIAMAAL